MNFHSSTRSRNPVASGITNELAMSPGTQTGCPGCRHCGHLPSPCAAAVEEEQRTKLHKVFLFFLSFFSSPHTVEQFLMLNENQGALNTAVSCWTWSGAWWHNNPELCGKVLKIPFFCSLSLFFFFLCIMSV